MTGGTEEMQAVLDHVWEQLLPGLHASDPAEGAQPELEQRLRTLSLAPVGGQPLRRVGGLGLDAVRW